MTALRFLVFCNTMTFFKCALHLERFPDMKNCYLLPWLVFALVGSAAEEQELAFLQASVAFDQALIPALVSTKSGRAETAIPAMDRLTEAWEVYKAEQAPTLTKASGWSLIRDGIDRRLTMAGRFVASSDIGMAHVLLEQVRADLIRIRQVLGRETFIDGLVAFHDRMEAALLEGPPSLAEMDRNTLLSKVDALDAYWTELEEDEFNADVFGYLWSDTSDLKRRLINQRRAIDALREAVAGGRLEDVDQLAAKVIKGFQRIYLSFGS